MEFTEEEKELLNTPISELIDKDKFNLCLAIFTRKWSNTCFVRKNANMTF